MPISESQFEEIIAKHPDLIEPGLILINRQRRIKNLRIDLEFEDIKANILLVELKLNTVIRSDIGQLIEYHSHFPNDNEKIIRPMIIAHHVPDNMKRALSFYNIEYKEISLPAISPFLNEVVSTMHIAHSSIPGEPAIADNMDRAYGFIRNVKNDKKDRYEIHFHKIYASFFNYGDTAPAGKLVRLLINGQDYQIGYHQTHNNNYLWLSSRVNRDGYNLAALLKSMNILHNVRIAIENIGNDSYKLTSS